MAVTKVVGAWPLPDGVTLEEVDGTLRIKDGGVTTDKIANGAVTDDKLASKYVRFVAKKSIQQWDVVEFTGLNLTRETFYVLYMTAKNEVSGAWGINLYRKDDTNDANYYSRRLRYTSSGTSVASGNNARLVDMPGDYKSVALIAWITADEKHRMRVIAQGVRNEGDASHGFLTVITNTTSGTPITAIKIESTLTNVMTGHFLLYEYKS